MKRPLVTLAALASLYLLVINATNDPPAYAYRGFSKQLWVALGLHHFSHPCWHHVDDEHGGFGTSLPTDQCYRMSDPKRMRGVWIDQDEGSRFLPDARDVSQAEVGSRGIWLDVETNRIPGLYPSTGELRAFEVEFVGRQTAVQGRYGHMGGSDHDVIVDQLVSARPVDVTSYAEKLDRWREEYRQRHE